MGIVIFASMGKRKDASAATKKVVAPKKPSLEEEALIKKVEALVNDSNSVRGRDASIISVDADMLRVEADAMVLTDFGRELIDKQLKEVSDALAFEKNSGRFLQIAVMIVMFVPMILTFLGNIFEYAVRPTMEVAAVDLSASSVVLTGGCGTVGLQLAIMLAEAGASVVIGCHSSATRSESELQAESLLSNIGLLHGSDVETSESARRDRMNPDRGTVRVWPLQLESFEDVRRFGKKVVEEFQTVDVLIHNAATKAGCNTTVDGHELIYQVNYMSPFLLTQLLLPHFQSGGKTRVVHVTCDAGLQQADYLPWPLARTSPELLPQIDTAGLALEADRPERCVQLVQYANSKSMLVSHSHELNRRLNHGFVNQGLSHAVNPGAMNSEFGRTDSSPSAKASMRSSMMGYFPPVWLGRKLYSVTFGLLGDGMLRSVEHGVKAVFHAATASALGSEENGGGLFSDEAGAFINCGGPAGQCGRVPDRKQPEAVTDKGKAQRLWTKTEEMLGAHMLRPLVEPEAADEEQEEEQQEKVEEKAEEQAEEKQEETAEEEQEEETAEEEKEETVEEDQDSPLGY